MFEIKTDEDDMKQMAGKSLFDLIINASLKEVNSEQEMLEEVEEEEKNDHDKARGDQISDEIEEEEKLKEQIDNQTEMRKEGQLQIQSMYLKQFRKRFVILKENHLFCYKDDTKQEVAELIDLSTFKTAVSSSKQASNFEVLPINDKDRGKIFAAKDESAAIEWIKIINQCIQAGNFICFLVKDLQSKTRDVHRGKTKCIIGGIFTNKEW